MQHLRFKAEQTAAHYVANGLDNETQEAFEMHMMDCAECVSDVEIWRALKTHLPEAANEHTSGPESPTPSTAEVTEAKAAVIAAPTRQALRGPESPRWRMAASLVGVGLIGLLAGWFAHEAKGPGAALAGGEALVYNLPPVSRGISCMPLPLEPRASIVLLRIPDAAAGATVVAQSADGTPLAKEDYSQRVQQDGSWLLQFRSSTLRNRAISLAVQGPEPTASQSLGCITGLGPD